MEIKNLHRPCSLDELRQLFNEKKRSQVLGGCTFLKMTDKLIADAIDLSNLSLSNIEEVDDFFEIGAYASYGDLERDERVASYADSLIVRAIGSIVGTQFRNSVSVGGSVFSKYSFSDFLTALLVLKAEVLLLNDGRMSLNKFLEREYKRDVLLKIFIPKFKSIRSEFQSIRLNSTDFPMINAAASRIDGDYLISFGARPKRAKLAINTSHYINEYGIDDKSLAEAKNILVAECSFGSNNLCSSEYRRAVSKNLFERVVKKIS